MNWQKFTERKFWMAVAGAIVVLLNEGLGWDIDANTIQWFVLLLASWIVGESYVDSKKEYH